MKVSSMHKYENKKSSSNTLISADLINGRSTFHVKMTDNGLAITPVFVSLDGAIHYSPDMPAIFPTLQYALSQIEGAKVMACKLFSEKDPILVKKLIEQYNSI